MASIALGEIARNICKTHVRYKSFRYEFQHTPWKINMVHLQITHLERKMIMKQTSMIMELEPMLIFRGCSKNDSEFIGHWVSRVT